MTVKKREKDRAIQLRRQGKTYNEILEVVPVSKSTLSLWLRSVQLSVKQEHVLTAKKRAAQIKGANRRRETRIQDTADIHHLCKQDIQSLTQRELFLVGVALYWAEGTKKNGMRTDMTVDFANSDPAMIALFIIWLQKCCKVPKNQVKLRLHLHESSKNSEEYIKKQWSKRVGIPLSQFTNTQYKVHNPKTTRYAVGAEYIGLVSVRVVKSTFLHRQIMGWIYAIMAAKL